MLFPLGSLPDGPRLDTKKALLLLDFQNDFTSVDGALAAKNVKTFLTKLPSLVARFRENGEVVWTRTEYREPVPTVSPETGAYSVLLKQFVKQDPEFDDNTSGYATPKTEYDGSQPYSEPIIEPDAEAFLAMDLPPGSQRCCLPGSRGAQLPAVIESAINRQKDFVITKTQYSAFADMSLLLQLRTRMVTDLYVCGSLSNISVYATVLDAVRHGFGVTLIEDCLGYHSEECHDEAVRQMADSMCAEGIDYQELMDDLAGMLGDVIKEEDYPTRYHVDVSRPQLSSQARTSEQNVNDWISAVETSRREVDSSTDSKRRVSKARPVSSGSEGGNESSLDRTIRQRSSTIESSPPRKRSTNDLEEQDDVSPKTFNNLGGRHSSHEPFSTRPEPRGKKQKIRLRKSQHLGRETPCPRQTSQFGQAYSTGDISDAMSPRESLDEPLPPLPSKIRPATLDSQPTRRQTPKKAPQVFVGPNDDIGDGTSKVIYAAVDDAFALEAFDILKQNVAWQKMYHRTGEVPRLVAVQGDVVHSSMDGSVTFPVYRHPADESPELLAFDATVDKLRRVCEQHVGHTLNHVLIQHYRTSEDNISEHSDKTLDIVRGSNIVNLSLGARRTMTLRTKRIDATPITTDLPLSPASRAETSRAARETQRVHLPHNSLFVLSTSTNAKYLHSIRADKRPVVEKSPEELAFDQHRISLTFRHIGTYITSLPNGKQMIWGQGATRKTRRNASQILSGTQTAASQGEKMVIAFGKENHEGISFDWDGVYGKGFDVLNFEVKRTDTELDTSAAESYKD